MNGCAVCHGWKFSYTVAISVLMMNALYI